MKKHADLVEGMDTGYPMIRFMSRCFIFSCFEIYCQFWKEEEKSSFLQILMTPLTHVIKFVFIHNNFFLIQNGENLYQFLLTS